MEIKFNKKSMLHEALAILEERNDFGHDYNEYETMQDMVKIRILREDKCKLQTMLKMIEISTDQLIILNEADIAVISRYIDIKV